MAQSLSRLEKMSCRLEMTTSARRGIGQWFIDERDFLSLQDTYIVHIEKRPMNQHGNMSFSLYFDNVANEPLAKHLNDRVAVMECVYKNEGLLATGFRVRGKKEPVWTNRRHAARLKLHLGNNGITMPIQLYTSIRELSIAEERSAYVKKRIGSWEGYLRIEEKNADVADIKTVVSNATINADFSKLTLVCKQLPSNKLKKIVGFSAKVVGSADEIGNVMNVSRSRKSVEIELNRKYKDLARSQSWNSRQAKEVIFSNFAELSQIRRLRKGFTDLQSGFAANANLERILFEERPTVQISKRKVELEFHNELNEFQQEAVKGAMTSNDLYVIQGPPGTGKTTVISEICHQNVKAGLRTLVASQSNLAVDNALSRLLLDQDVRILRFGRTESIEEEGKKFIEENVALNWKKETLFAVNEQRKRNAVQKEEIENELNDNASTRQILQSELTILEEKIQLKKENERELRKLKTEFEKLQHKVRNLNEKKDILYAEQETLTLASEQSLIELNQIQMDLEKEKAEVIPMEEVEKLTRELQTLNQLSSYFETTETIAYIKNNIRSIRDKIELIGPRKVKLRSFTENIRLITKLDSLKKAIHQSGVKFPMSIDLQINELNRMISLIQSQTFSYEFNEWKDLNDRLATATKKIEQLLHGHQYPVQNIQKRTSEQFKSASEIHELLDRIGRYLINPKTKQLLHPKSQSVQKSSTLEKIAKNLSFLYGKQDEVALRTKTIKERFFGESKRKFASIQLEIGKYLRESLVEIEQGDNQLQEDLDNQLVELTNQQESVLKLKELVGVLAENLTVNTLQDKLIQKEHLYTKHKDNKLTIEQLRLLVKEKQSSQQKVVTELEKLKVDVQTIYSEDKSLRESLLSSEQVISDLAEKIAVDLESQQEALVTKIDVLHVKEQRLKDIQKRMPVTHALQDEWHTLLEGATAYDLDEIRKLYVQYANVIGTTCVASARKTFMEDYPTFDVVIIDEVSKATPPELLLPMLKGKKIILVGDHHQLPPLVGQETLEELVDESSNNEEKRELKKLLKESLFERLFRSLPTQNKTMLGIQYRMHETIMQTITPFYKEDNYNLQCGVLNSDKNRDHLLQSRYIKREDHLLWFDMPNTEAYFEAQVKGGTSRYNQGELDMIRDLLIDFDEATDKAKQEGRMKVEEKKSVGIISFYGEQVKRIDRMLQHELMPKHLNYRTGSVDKFQGMEMDIIILSFVRNHNHKGGDIGFAKDYRRLNVALSRARELLVIVGSSEMFTKQTKNIETQKMYRRLLEHVESNNGLKTYVKRSN